MSAWYVASTPTARPSEVRDDTSHVGVGDVLTRGDGAEVDVRFASAQSSQRDTVSATRARALRPTGGRSPSSRTPPSRSSSAT